MDGFSPTYPGVQMLLLYTGNGGNEEVVLEDLVVRDFEVAGIQLNGASDVVIRSTTVGPSGESLVTSTYASARLMGFWFSSLYKHSWTRDEQHHLLHKNTIQFARYDRRPVKIFNVSIPPPVWQS